MAAVVAPLLQRYEYGGVPPVCINVALPVFPPAHAMSVFVTDNDAPLTVTAVDEDAVQPVTSVTVTV